MLCSKPVTTIPQPYHLNLNCGNSKAQQSTTQGELTRLDLPRPGLFESIGRATQAWPKEASSGVSPYLCLLRRVMMAIWGAPCNAVHHQHHSTADRSRHGPTHVQQWQRSLAARDSHHRCRTQAAAVSLPELETACSAWKKAPPSEVLAWPPYPIV